VKPSRRIDDPPAPSAQPEASVVSARARRLLIALLVAAGVAGPITATPALANSTVNVNSTADETHVGDGMCSLREAIAYANGSLEPDCLPSPVPAAGTTTINVPASPSHYFLTGGQLEIDAGRSVAIKGRGVGSLGTTIDAAHGSRALFVFPGANAAVIDLTITNGQAPAGDPGGGIFNDGTLNLTDATVSDNAVGAGSSCGGHGGEGGGIFNNGALTLAGVTVTGNAAGSGNPSGTANCSSPGGGGDGGGIFSDGPVTLTNTTVSDNAAGNGGGATCELTGGGPSGGSGGMGGGIASFTSTLSVTASTISRNAAGIGGCGRPGGAGGGIASIANTLTLAASTINGNESGRGGAGNVTASGASGAAGGSGGAGGGVFSSGPLAALNSTIAENTAGSGGVGGSDLAGGNGGSGGAIVQAGSSATLTNLTIADNQTGTGGAANNATAVGGPGFANGAAGAGSAINTVNGGSVDEANTIVQGACAGTVDDLGHNLVWDSHTCPGSLAFPSLGPLAGNGGPTATLAIPSSSPAADQIPATPTSCPATDQRGFIRPDFESTCDIGAYESGAFPPLRLGLQLTAGLTAPPRFFGLALHGTEPRGATVVSILHTPRTLVLLVRKLENHGRLSLVGLVRLGHRSRGRSSFHWNLRVDGHTLGKGRYQVVMYALDGGNVLSLPANPGARTVIVQKGGTVRT
jgi:CSLREA domain-containing protein